jgi:hypothetical protein
MVTMATVAQGGGFSVERAEGTCSPSSLRQLRHGHGIFLGHYQLDVVVESLKI